MAFGDRIRAMLQASKARRQDRADRAEKYGFSSAKTPEEQAQMAYDTAREDRNYNRVARATSDGLAHAQSKGDRGAQKFDPSDPSSVLAMQHTLNTAGYLGADGRPLVLDGKFGKNTEAALRAMQAHGGSRETSPSFIGPMSPMTASTVENSNEYIDSTAAPSGFSGEGQKVGKGRMSFYLPSLLED